MCHLKRMDEKLQNQLDEQEIKINQIYESVKKTERYLKLTFWVSLLVIVIPLILAAFVLPAFMDSYVRSYSELLSL